MFRCQHTPKTRERAPEAIVPTAHTTSSKQPAILYHATRNVECPSCPNVRVRLAQLPFLAPSKVSLVQSKSGCTLHTTGFRAHQGSPEPAQSACLRALKGLSCHELSSTTPPGDPLPAMDPSTQRSAGSHTRKTAALTSGCPQSTALTSDQHSTDHAAPAKHSAHQRKSGRDGQGRSRATAYTEK